MKLREQKLRRIIKEEMNFLKEEKRIIQEIDMSFFDWVIGGMGIELGRYLLQFVLTVGVVALSGLALSIKTFIQTHRELKRERNNPIAKKAQNWLANHSVFKDLTKLTKEVEKVRKDRDDIHRKLDPKNLLSSIDSELFNKYNAINSEFAQVKARRKKIVSQIIKDAEKELSPEEVKYLGKKLWISE